MAKATEELSLPDLSASHILTLCYGTFARLGWVVEFAVPERLVGYTKKKWKQYIDHVFAEPEEGKLFVTVKLPQESSLDLRKTNQKKVAQFIAAFEEVKASATEADITQWNAAVAALQESTAIRLAEEQKEEAEVERVMKTSSGKIPVTIGISVANVLLFIIMAIAGVGIMEPTSADLIVWGANFEPYTTGGQWWRLFSCIFIHIGIIHLLLNMYALYTVGVYLEPMLGKLRYLSAYISTGIIASVVSIWWKDEPVVSAGASGAIFGLYGLFFALLTTNLIPAKTRKALLQSIGIFVAYNLLYGAAKSGIDNAAHLGGLVSGFAVGFLFLPSLRSETPGKSRGLSIALLVATIIGTGIYLNSAKDDSLAYEKQVDKVLALQAEAMAAYADSTLSEAELLNKINLITQPRWVEAKQLVFETTAYKNLPDRLLKHRELLMQYVDLRVKESTLHLQSLHGNHARDGELVAIQQQIDETLEKMNK